MRHRALRYGILIGLLAAGNVRAGITAADADGVFVIGLQAYEAHQYERAAHVFEQLLAVKPDCARCAHLLGRSYGHMAESAGWLSAITLAKKTREALERAVKLDPSDRQALRDLISYYRAAPEFLGGSAEKAKALEERLLHFDTGGTS